MELRQLVNHIADVIVAIDASGVSHKTFAPGVGPYGEPQLVGEVARRLSQLGGELKGARTRRTPDLLIPFEWAIEFKIARPFGDNGKEAENWSVNLLHPYAGNVSSVGDCLKLAALDGPERKAVVVVGYEHDPARIDLSPLIQSFELVATQVAGIELGVRVEVCRTGLVHSVHQTLRIFAWEVLAPPPSAG